MTGKIRIRRSPPPRFEPASRPVPKSTVLLLMLATFGGTMAMVLPMAYSLTVKIDELAPNRIDLLGCTLGLGAAATLLLAPLTGVLSDRTRSRLGRRRPFILLGLVLGIASTPVMILAQSHLVLTLGWMLSTVGWGTAVASIGNWQADLLPASQRGKVTGLVVMAGQTAPVFGLMAVGMVRDDTRLVLLIPVLVGVLFVGAFIAFAPEANSRGFKPAGPLSLRHLASSYVFHPRRTPDFSWTWLGRFLFFMGLSLTASFTVYFYALRLEIPISQVANILAITSALNLLSAFIGSMLTGWLSDRIGRRRPFLLLAGLVYAAGSVISAFAYEIGPLVLGTLTASLGIAIFTAVGGALVLDVLPNRDTEAGRYMAITTFSQKIPAVLAPLTAPLLLLSGGMEQNFTLLYLVSGTLAVMGGTVIGTLVRSTR